MNRSFFRTTTGAALLAVAAAGLAVPHGLAAANGAKSRAFTVVENGSYVPPAPPPPPAPVVRHWEVPADVPLRQVFQTWAGAEGWSVYWPAAADGSDWVSEVSVRFQADDFQQAVTKVIEGLPPKVGLAATFNRANSPMLLHVSESPAMQEIR